MNITYPINALPRAIPLCLGVQSEYGARPISIDVSEWVGRWPDIIVSVQPVRPGEDVSYLAAGVTRSGNIVTWTPNAYDTDIPGTGSVEIIGLADGVKIIRTGAATSIAPTKSSVSKTPEDPMAAWADSVIRAGEQAKSSAEEALLLAQAANKSANNANASAVQAQSSQRAAATSASQAATYRTDAVNAMNVAKNSQTQAKASEQAASTLANAAYKSQQRAEAAAKRAEDAANSMGGGAVSPGDGKLKADAIMCDKSGEVVSIADASEMDALSVVSHIDSPEGVTEITLTRTGKNIWGGMALAQSIASQVDGAVLDVDAKTVTYDAGKIKAVNVFDKFELGKRYTVIFARDESKSKGTTANIRIIYDTGEALNISFNSGNTAVVTTAANKNVEKLLGYNSSGPTCLLYEQCGVFEGVLTAEDFVPSEAETFTVTLPEAVTDGTFEWATGVLTINQDGASRTVQLDAQPIALQDGYNTLWSSTGQTDVRYVADTKAYVDGHGADADSEYAENAGYADNAGYAEEAGDAQTVKGRDIAAEVDALSEEIETIKSGGETEVTLEIPVGFPDAGSNLGYINASGKLIAGTEMFQHTDPISMKAGDRLDFAVKGYRKETVILAVLAKVSGSGYVKLIDTDVATLMDYSYTADTDCQVVISYDNRTTYSGTVYATRAVGGEHYGDAAHYVNRSDNVVAIKSRYNAEEDIVVEIALAGGNKLPNPKRIYTVDKYSDAIDASLTPSRYLLNRYTDWFSPHQVRAADNADGDDIATVIFTGGNHMSNNSSSGGTVTAVCTQFDVLCDGALVENGNEKYCNSVVINITNEICGYNTWKADGTGRRILKEQIRITIGLTAKMNVEIIHTAFEDVQRMRYYGLQCVNDAYTAGIQYLGGTNRALNPIDAASDCGNKTCRDGRLLSSNGDVMLTHMDEVDLGSFAYAPSNDASYFATTATKAYFSLISNSGAASEAFSQSAGEQTCCRGWYDFVHA